MPKSIKRFDEKDNADQYDKTATELIAQAIQFERQAATATTPESATECRATAQELRNRALEPLKHLKSM